MTETAAATTDGPKGIGGWLVLVALGLVVTPIILVVFTVRDVLPAFEAETWALLTTPGSTVYHPSTAALLIFEVTANTGYLIFTLVINYFFWNKSRRLPKLIIVWMLTGTVIVAIDTFWALQIPFVAEEMDGSYYKDLARSIIQDLVWIPYFLISRRVKNTFVE
jgi:hypothetical protein